MMKWVVLAVFLAPLTANEVLAQTDEALEHEWRDLFARCRVAIESGLPPDTSGLVDLGFEDRFVEAYTVNIEGRDVPILPGFRRAARTWQHPDRRLVLIDGERFVGSADGAKVRRLCDVRLAEGAAKLTSSEEGAILRIFLVIRSNLIADGTHEVRDPDPIPPIIPLGVGPIKDNPNYCPVMSAVFFQDDHQFFASISGEQDFSPCGGASLLTANQ
jgi:hypothetical protein